ncbi:MAG: hypothetical protein AAF995_04260 [Planctomycetota bacterium]
MHPTASDRAFGVSILPTDDIDNDGWLDVAVASVVRYTDNTTATRLTVFTIADGIARVRLYPAEDEHGSLDIAKVLVGDLDGSSVIDNADVVTALLVVANGTDTSAADMDLDLDVTVHDAAHIAHETGTTLDTWDTSVFELALANAYADGPAPGGDGSDFALLGGLFDAIKKWIDCALCAFDCDEAMADADDCKDVLWDARCQCFCDYNAFDLELSACLNDARLSVLPDCISAVAAAAGQCASCIEQCHPLVP